MIPALLSPKNFRCRDWELEPGAIRISNPIDALVAKLADALDLGSSAVRRKGSSPFRSTKNLRIFKLSSYTHMLIENFKRV